MREAVEIVTIEVVATLYNRVTHQRVFIWLVTFLGIALAPVLAYFTCTLGWKMDLIIAGLMIVAAWTFLARDRWWVPFPALSALGGTFYFGFKIPMYEMALLICLLPLLLAVSTRWQGAIAGRAYPSPSVFLLAVYIFLHWIGSLIYNQMQGLGGAGTVTRTYMGAFWPFILFFTYYFFGNSKYIKTAFALLYWATFLRLVLGLLGFFFPAFLYIPGINYVPSTSSLPDDDSGITAGDLRGSCPAMFIVSLCYACLSKSELFRLWNVLLMLVCVVAVFMGGGRLGALNLLLIPLYWAILRRRFLLILLLTCTIGSALVFLNLSPGIIDGLPVAVQRTLAGFIVKKGILEIQNSTESSDAWHADLQKAGFNRWTESVHAFLIGHGIRPFSKQTFEQGTFEDQVKVAVDTSRFESALWSVLATFGIVGMVLYLLVLRFLLADSIPLLWEKGICDYQTAMAFITSFSIVLFILLGNFAGGYPSSEIMMALFAKTLHDDQMQRDAEVENVKKVAI